MKQSFLKYTIIILVFNILCLGMLRAQDVCVGETKNYWVDINENNGQGTSGSTYQWQVNTPGFGGVITPDSNFPQGNQIQIEWINTAPGQSYELEVIETNEANCINNQILNINLLDTPDVNLPEYSDCNEVTIDAGFNPDYTYVWQVPSGVTNPGDQSSFTTNVSGEYTVTVSFQGMCPQTFTTTVEIFETPVIQEVQINGTSAVIIASGGENLEYSIDGGITWSSSNSFIVEPGQVLSIMVRNSNGCMASTTAVVDFPTQNTITPNGDGKNDYFEFRGLDAYPNAEFKVFDRYGKEIFNSRNSNSFRWDGTYLGRPIPTTTYWYTLNLGDGSEKMTGYILVKNANQ